MEGDIPLRILFNNESVNNLTEPRYIHILHRERSPSNSQSFFILNRRNIVQREIIASNEEDFILDRPTFHYPVIFSNRINNSIKDKKIKRKYGYIFYRIITKMMLKKIINNKELNKNYYHLLFDIYLLKIDKKRTNELTKFMNCLPKLNKILNLLKNRLNKMKINNLIFIKFILDLYHDYYRRYDTVLTFNKKVETLKLLYETLVYFYKNISSFSLKKLEHNIKKLNIIFYNKDDNAKLLIKDKDSFVDYYHKEIIQIFNLYGGIDLNNKNSFIQ